MTYDVLYDVKIRTLVRVFERWSVYSHLGPCIRGRENRSVRY